MSEVLDRPRSTEGLNHFLVRNGLAADWLDHDEGATDRDLTGQPTAWVWTWKK